MRILYITDGLGGGGKERQIYELICGLIGSGFESPDGLRVLCLDWKAIYSQNLENVGVRIESPLGRSKIGLGGPLEFIRIWRSFRPDIVHSFIAIGTFFSVWPRILRSFRLIDGSIRSAPNSNSLPCKIRFLNRFNYRFADVIVANSRSGLISFRPPTQKSIVIHNGFNFGRIVHLIPPGQLKKRLAITGKKIIGMVANFFPSKDYETFLSAAQILLEQREDIVFLAIGFGSLLEHSRRSVHQRHQNSIFFLGRQDDVESWVNIFDVAVLTTITEGISNSIMEYMALGKPVIATDCTGTREIIEDGVSGILIRPADAEVLAAKINLLLQDEGRRKQLGQAAALRIQQDFSLDRMISAYCRLYSKLVRTAFIPEN